MGCDGLKRGMGDGGSLLFEGLKNEEKEKGKRGERGENMMIRGKKLDTKRKKERKKTHKSPRCTQRTRMHTLQHTVHRPINLGHPLPSRLPPYQKNHSARAHFSHGVDDFLCEFLPAVIRMAVRFGRFDSQAGIEHEHAAVRPGDQETAVFGRRLEIRIVVFQGNVHVHERRRGSSGRPHGEGQAVGLVHPVVGVLADYYGFDGVKGSVLRPFRWQRGGGRERFSPQPPALCLISDQFSLSIFVGKGPKANRDPLIEQTPKPHGDR